MKFILGGKKELPWVVSACFANMSREVLPRWEKIAFCQDFSKKIHRRGFLARKNLFLRPEEF